MRADRVRVRPALSAIAPGLSLIAVAFSLTPKVSFGQAERMVMVPMAASNITFTATVPPAPAEAQVYNLAVTPVPTEFLNEKLSAAKLPALRLEQRTLISRGVTGPTPTDQVRAFANPENGDVHFLPNLTGLATAPNQARPRLPRS